MNHSKFSGFFAPIIDNFRQPRMAMRTVILFISVTFMGIAVGLLKLVGWGTDPMSTLSFGLSMHTPISMGTWQLMSNCLLFIPILIRKRSCIGLGTLANMVIIGYVVDIVLAVSSPLTPEAGLSVAYRAVLFLIGILMFLFAAAFYCASNLGVSAYDAIPYLITDLIPRLPFRAARIIWDTLYALAGIALGADFGLTTLLLCFGLGPVISAITKWITPVLNKKQH